MDKNVYNMKAEKIQKYVKQGDYESAEKICDTIEWNQIRRVRMLSLVSSVYEHTGKYDKAIDVLLMAYEEAPAGRRLLYKLTELALAAKEISDAEDYYKLYRQEAGDDNARYVLRYKIAKAKKEPIAKRISILEAYKLRDFDEQWAFELAMLYAESNQGEKCVKLCDDIVLWFGVGTYVDKALELKEKFAPLTDKQLEHRSKRGEYEDNLRDVQREFSDNDDIPEDIAAVLARGVAEETTHTPDEGFEETVQNVEVELHNEEMPEVAISDNTPAATESGQALSSLDKSAFIPDDEAVRMELPEEEEDKNFNTRKVHGKNDFARTRIYKGKNGSNTRVMKPITEEVSDNTINYNTEKANEALAAAAVAAEMAAEAEPIQEEFNWEEEKSEPAEKIIYLGVEHPSEVDALASQKIKEGHESEGTKMLQLTKITATKLNTKGVINSLEALKGKDLIILGAHALDDVIVDEIKKVTEMFDPSKFFVLADSAKGIEAIKARFDQPAEGQADQPVEEVATEEPEAETASPVAEETVVGAALAGESLLEAQDDIPEIKLSEYFYDPSEVGNEEEVAKEELEAEETPEEATAEVPVETEAMVEETVEETAEEAEEEIAPVEASIDLEEEISADDIDIKISDEKPVVEEPTEEVVEETPSEVDVTEEAEETQAPVESSAEGSMTINDFLTFIKEYMGKIDCVYDAGAEDSVRKYVETLAKEGELLDTSLAIDMVEDAADQAEKHSLGNLFKSKYDKEGHLILRGNNFE